MQKFYDLNGKMNLIFTLKALFINLKCLPVKYHMQAILLKKYYLS